MTRRPSEKSTPPQYPEGWRTGPAWRELDGRAARRRRILGGAGAALAVAVGAVVVVDPGGVRSRIPGDWGRKKETTTVAADTVTLDHPFAGSPAEEYADGAAGIVIPEAAAVGESSKEQVASALKLTKDFLVAANLDPATLRGERPAAALGLIEPGDDLIGKMNASLSKPGKENDPLAFFSRFDPNQVRLVGDIVKTRGRMTFAEREGGVVTVHADYTFVYPLTKKDKKSRQIARTIVRRVLDVEVPDPARFRVEPGKLVVRRHVMDIGNTTCEIHDGFIHPEFPRITRHGDGRDGSERSGPAVDPYDSSRDLGNRHDECGTVTRT
ncbi:hypothetical protein [Streptomyces abikoensis]|uniref:hypothetical protein n=1 Tax=Streptomyces abikoensis TaxID=97398 RepID=UPI001673E4F2|nr:hypothetical protein [Streptomyces abikoensis]